MNAVSQRDGAALLRLDVLRAIEQPRTVAEVARICGVSKQRVAYHLRQLSESGRAEMVEVSGARAWVVKRLEQVSGQEGGRENEHG